MLALQKYFLDQYLTDNLIQKNYISQGASLQSIEMDSAWFGQKRDYQKDSG